MSIDLNVGLDVQRTYFMYIPILRGERQSCPGAVPIAFLSLLIAYVCPLAATAAPKTQTGISALNLRQTNKMAGDCDVLISNLGLRLTTKKTNLTFLFLPPYNEAICFARDSGKIFRCPIKSFRNTFSTSMTLLAAFTLEDARLKAAGRVKQGALDLVKFETTSEFEAMQLMRLKNRELGSLSPHHLVLLAADKLPYDKRISVLLERIYGLPKTGLIPISVRYRSVGGEDTAYLTTGVCRPCKIDAKTMQIPTGLKAARDLSETLETKSSPEAIDLMMLK